MPSKVRMQLQVHRTLFGVLQSRVENGEEEPVQEVQNIPPLGEKENVGQEEGEI